MATKKTIKEEIATEAVSYGAKKKTPTKTTRKTTKATTKKKEEKPKEEEVKKEEVKEEIKEEVKEVTSQVEEAVTLAAESDKPLPPLPKDIIGNPYAYLFVKAVSDESMQLFALAATDLSGDLFYMESEGDMHQVSVEDFESVYKQLFCLHRIKEIGNVKEVDGRTPEILINFENKLKTSTGLVISQFVNFVSRNCVNWDAINENGNDPESAPNGVTIQPVIVNYYDHKLVTNAFKSWATKPAICSHNGKSYRNLIFVSKTPVNLRQTIADNMLVTNLDTYLVTPYIVADSVNLVEYASTLKKPEEIFYNFAEEDDNNPLKQVIAMREIFKYINQIN